ARGGGRRAVPAGRRDRRNRPRAAVQTRVGHVPVGVRRAADALRVLLLRRSCADGRGARRKLRPRALQGAGAIVPGGMRLPDAAGWEVSLLCVGSLEFEAGTVLPDAAATVPVNVLLLRGHGETLPVDAGSGPADVLWPGAARLG